MGKNYSSKSNAGSVWLIIGSVLVVALTVWVIFSGVSGVSDIIDTDEFAKSLAETFDKTVKGVNEEDMAKVRYIEIFNNQEAGTYSVAYGLDDLLAEMESEAEDADVSKYYHAFDVKADDFNLADLKLLSGLKEAVVYMANGFDLDNFSASAKGLENLTYYYSSPADISKVGQFTALKEASFLASGIEDVAAFASLTNLEGLYLDSNAITDVAPLASLTKLEVLSVGSNKVTDISALSSLTALKELYVNNNSELADISVVENFASLEVLHASDCALTDASFANKLAEIKTLGLDNNEISDVTYFGGLNTEKLEELSLTGNPIKDTSYFEYLGDKFVFEVAEQETETAENTAEENAQ